VQSSGCYRLTLFKRLSTIVEIFDNKTDKRLRLVLMVLLVWPILVLLCTLNILNIKLDLNPIYFMG